MKVPSGAKFMRDRSVFSSIGDWLQANLGIASILNLVSAMDRRVAGIQSSLVGIDQAIVNLSAKVLKLENKMATLDDVKSLIESAKADLKAKIEAERAQIVAAIEAAKADPTPAVLDEVIALVNGFSAEVGSGIEGLVVPEVVEEEPAPVEPVE